MRLVAVPFYNLTVVGNANGKFILTPTIAVRGKFDNVSYEPLAAAIRKK